MTTTPLLTVREVAAVLRLAPWTVYRLAREGVLPSIRISTNCVRFTDTDVAAFIAAHHSPACSLTSG